MLAWITTWNFRNRAQMVVCLLLTPSVELTKCRVLPEQHFSHNLTYYIITWCFFTFVFINIQKHVTVLWSNCTLAHYKFSAFTQKCWSSTMNTDCEFTTFFNNLNWVKLNQPLGILTLNELQNKLKYIFNFILKVSLLHPVF
jgi:hypothetical protein